LASVSVVIPCYNYGHFLPEAVSSVLDDQGDVDVRVLVIDDASPDGSAEVAKDIARRDPRVEVRAHTANRGHIATYNEGLLGWADGDYTVLLSADDRLAPGALVRATRFLDAHPNVGFVYGNPIWFQDGEPLPPARTSGRGNTWWPGHTWLEQRFRQAQSGISSPEVVVRTALQKRVGGYNPGLPHLGDTEMWLRLAAHGDVGYLRGVDQAYYRRHALNMSIAYTPLPTLQQYRLVYESVLERHGERLPDAERLSDLVHRKMASEALWSAARAYDRGRADETPVEDLVAFAFDCWPQASRLAAYRALQMRRAVGPRVMPYLQPLVLPGVVTRKMGSRWEKRGWGFRRNSLRWLSWS
jgi:glycosyltransferase involved in cell wall biosynthesis